jgi:hypothetical protein
VLEEDVKTGDGQKRRQECPRLSGRWIPIEESVTQASGGRGGQWLGKVTHSEVRRAAAPDNRA